MQEVGKHRHAFGHKELLELKRIYRVSGAALLVRLRDLGIVDQKHLVYAFQTVARGWRTEEPAPLEDPQKQGQLEPVCRFERLCYRALAENAISAVKASELLKKPVDVIEKELTGRSNAL